MMTPDHCPMAAIGKFLRRTKREKLLIAIAAATLIAVRIELKLIGFRHRGWIGDAHPPRPNESGANRRAGGISASEIAWAVKAASGRIPGATNCLVRALALKYLLGLFGYDARLRLGAGHLEGGRFEAHAWIESGGRILIGEFDNGQYAPFSIPGEGQSPPNVQ
jgi:hypothetical protein